MIPSNDAATIMAAVRSACRIRGLDDTGARILHHYSNAVVLLPNEAAVARVPTGRYDASQVRHSVRVTRWLVDHHNVAATRPLFGADPVDTDTMTVSFWVHYHQPVAPSPLTSAHLGRLLADLHAIADTSTDGLRSWVPLNSLEQALHGDTTTRVLDDGRRQWLVGRIREVREELATLDWPLGLGLIHGDAWAGNLLWSSADRSEAHALLGDWDQVACGPREIDLIPTWHAAHRYGKGREWIRAFRSYYDYDLSSWSGFSALLAMRDLVQVGGPLRRAAHSQLHARALEQRVSCLRAGDTRTIWTAL